MKRSALPRDSTVLQGRHADGQQLSMLEQFVRHGIALYVNSDSWFAEMRYLLVLALAQEYPFRIHGTYLDDRCTFNCNQLYNLAKRFHIKFEKTKEAPRVLRKLEALGYIGSEKTERTKFRTQYLLTEKGKDETLKSFRSIIVMACARVYESTLAPRLLESSTTMTVVRQR
jgi:hypothetical protein